MKKVSNPKQIKLNSSRVNKNNKKNLNPIHRVENKMINKNSLIGKTGGNSFENYNLDLMKLS